MSLSTTGTLVQGLTALEKWEESEQQTSKAVKKWEEIIKTKAAGGRGGMSSSSERKNLEKLRKVLKHDIALMGGKCRCRCFSYTRRNFGR